MDFRIADTFTNSLAKLTSEEQKLVKTTAFDLQLNRSNPGDSFHKLDRAKDKNFWSVRVSRDIRIIVHKSESSLLLCYVDHHDKAYDWASRRKLEVHPKTGAAQIIEIRESVQEIVKRVYVTHEVEAIVRHPFEKISDDIFMSLGVPREWIDDVKKANEENMFDILQHLPNEASEALLEIATGDRKPELVPAIQVENPFEHPDAQRRFRVLTNRDELERALDFPWDKWAVFLHPSQKQIVEFNFSGPARVSGSAGTGKTIVALHRAVYLARKYEESRVLLTTFSKILANALKVKLRRLVSNEPRLAERIEVVSIDEIGQRLARLNLGIVNVATINRISELIKSERERNPSIKYSQNFLLSEFIEVVDAWRLTSWEEYRDFKRLGRKTRLPENQRLLLWTIFSSTISRLEELKLKTNAVIFYELAEHIRKTGIKPFDFAIVDEAQDISVYHLRFLATLGLDKPNALFFAGDMGQRIFQQPFSWRSVGVDIRGRAKTLTINYRTSHQIRSHSDKLLAPEISDVDGNTESRKTTISVFDGPKPEMRSFKEPIAESDFVGFWLRNLINSGIAPHEIGVFVRSENEIKRALAAIIGAKVDYVILDENVETLTTKVSISTMHLAKGLEFKAVVVMACDDEIIPLQERMESVTDNSDLEEVYNTERHLLYVACTRARERLLLTSVEPSSEFLGDFDN